MITMFGKEKVLSREEVRGILDNINHKKVIKYTSVGVLGMGIANMIALNSAKVDKFFLKDIGTFLKGSKYDFMYFPIPNWFILFAIISYIVILYLEIKCSTQGGKK